jgi:FdhD protein
MARMQWRAFEAPVPLALWRFAANPLTAWHGFGGCYNGHMKSSSLLERRSKPVVMRRVNGSIAAEETDFLAAEEPLEIRVEGHSIAVVMRTPGEERELAAGFLVTEGLVRTADEIVEIKYVPHCTLSARNGNGRRHRPEESTAEEGESSSAGGSQGMTEGNVVNVRLRKPGSLDLKQLTRNVFSSSSCGICSKASIAAVRQQFPPIEDDFEVGPQMLLSLPAVLASAQETFKRTGGLHACALFDENGTLQALREDVGRHNALDKVIGWALLAGRLPLRRHVLLLSGRTSFEMIQKALAAGIPVVAAISAPSSLAVEFAQESGQTLVGFLRGQKMNVYAGAERLVDGER